MNNNNTNIFNRGSPLYLFTSKNAETALRISIKSGMLWFSAMNNQSDSFVSPGNVSHPQYYIDSILNFVILYFSNTTI